MNEFARVPASSDLNEPGLSLVWTLPIAVFIWLALLFGFSRMLEVSAPLPAELNPVDARIVELPPEIGGLQGGPAPAAAAKPLPAVVKPVAIVHPHPITHPRAKLKPVVPRVMPSETGTAKSEETPPAESSGSATAHPGGGSGVPGGTGAGTGSGLGSDTAGARALYEPVPTIPDELREDALDTVAVAHFKVGYDGQVEVSLVKATSNPELNQILLDTLKQWRFFPAIKGGVAVASEFDLRIPITVQ